MGMFDNLKTVDDVQEDKEFTGGSKFGVLETDVYNMTIEMAYVDTAKSGAMSFNFTFKSEDGHTIRSTQYVTSGTAKGCKNYYVNKDGKKSYLPGFKIANDIALLAAGVEAADLEPEEKVINLYNFDLKKEAPTKKQVITQLLGQEITLGVVKQIVDKNVKDASGKYVPSGETREENEIDKVFRTSDNMSSLEVKAEAEEATAINTWIERNKGKVRNKAKGASAGTGTTPASSTPTKKLFGA